MICTPRHRSTMWMFPSGLRRAKPSGSRGCCSKLQGVTRFIIVLFPLIIPYIYILCTPIIENQLIGYNSSLFGGYKANRACIPDPVQGPSHPASAQAPALVSAQRAMAWYITGGRSRILATSLEIFVRHLSTIAWASPTLALGWWLSLRQEDLSESDGVHDGPCFGWLSWQLQMLLSTMGLWCRCLYVVGIHIGVSS